MLSRHMGVRWPTSLWRWHLFRLLLNGFEPQSGSNENGRWEGPPTEGGPMIQNRTSVKDQLMIAELGLYKNRTKKRKKKSMINCYA